MILDPMYKVYLKVSYIPYVKNRTAKAANPKDLDKKTDCPIPKEQIAKIAISTQPSDEFSLFRKKLKITPQTWY